MLEFTTACPADDLTTLDEVEACYSKDKSQPALRYYKELLDRGIIRQIKSDKHRVTSRCGNTITAGKKRKDGIRSHAQAFERHVK